jgi:hypothetical protein
MIFWWDFVMTNTNDLAAIEDKLRELRKLRDQLFVSQIELRINLEIIADKQEELVARSQYLKNISTFLSSEKDFEEHLNKASGEAL